MKNKIQKIGKKCSCGFHVKVKKEITKCPMCIDGKLVSKKKRENR